MSVLDLVGASGLSRITVDTKANILALTPVAAMIAYASDTNGLYIYDTSNWQVVPDLNMAVTYDDEVVVYDGEIVWLD